MINLKFAVRLLIKTPFVTAVAIASLALGIGANAAIFSVFNQILKRPLPVADPGTLVNFGGNRPNPGSQSCGQTGPCDEVFSYPMFRDLEREQKVFTGLAGHVIFGANLAARKQTVSANGVLVSGSYFPVLGVRPALGRLLGPDDDRQIGESHLVVLSYAYWQSAFNRDPGVLNEVMVVNGQSMTIIGVTPREFTGTTVGNRPDVYVPITMYGFMQPGFNGFDRRNRYWLYMFARLKPGVSLQQASAAMNVPYHAILNNVEVPLQKGLSDKTMEKFKVKKLELAPGSHGQSVVTTQARTPLMMLLAVTAFVLLIACANIANLLLARAASRSGEMAVRLSIGGSRGQLVAQLLAESFLLAIVGGGLGLLVAQVTLGVMSSLLPGNAGSSFVAKLDPTAIEFTAAITLVTAFAFGLFPALYATRPDLTSALRANTGQPSGGRSAARWRLSLATAQIALSMALLGTAGLFIRSLANVTRVDLGLQVEHVVTFGISPELSAYKPAQTQQLMQRMTEDLGKVPGVTGVTSALVPLLAGNNWGESVDVEGYPTGPDVDNNSRYNEVGAAYFNTVGIPILAGRDFSTTDKLDAPPVAIINQAFAKKFKLGANPVGKHISKGNKKYDITVVGLAKDAKYSDVKVETPPLFFIPNAQDSTLGSAAFYVRTTLDPKLLLPVIPRVMSSLDPNLPVEDLRTMPDQIQQNISMDRFISLFSAAFAGLATLLAAIGLYGVLAYTVSQRTREIGVRMALGAAPAQVLGMILRQVAMMTLIGGVIGIAAAVGVGRLSQSLLYQMQGYDPAVLFAAAASLSIVAMGAGLVPAFKASRVPPTRALRHE